MSGLTAAMIVKSVYVYPIKSCRGISVPQAPISPTGFRWDRQWLVINSANGRMFTQRVQPKLALVQVELPNQAFDEGWEPSKSSYLVVRAPGMIDLKVCLGTTGEKVDGVTIWGWTGMALDEGAEAAQWFSTYLGTPSRLVRFDTASVTRETDPDYARGYRTMFSDQFPFLVASQESLDELNNHLDEPVSIDRFRPNILVEGCEPFSEDLWKEIKINGLTFLGARLCSRCKVPSINQETGVAGQEPTLTLKKFRSDAVLLPTKKQQGQVFFGHNMVCKDSMSQGKGKFVRVGDPVQVIQKLSSANEAAV